MLAKAIKVFCMACEPIGRGFRGTFRPIFRRKEPISNQLFADNALSAGWVVIFVGHVFIVPLVKEIRHT